MNIGKFIKENIKFLGFWLAVAFIGAYILVISGSMGAQFILGELPCPLCVIQRYSMMLAVVGPIYIIVSTLKGEINIQKFAIGYGMSIIAACVGMISSVRQILLHISPEDPGFGGAFLGIHFYTWSLVTFFIVIVFCAANLIFADKLVPPADEITPFVGVAKLVVWVFFVIVIIAFIAMIFQQGFNFLLPDDPTEYQLFDLFK
ncbi:disulfide bond formation protein B [Vagococcus intermedius]|uniref:Disulfide bond formation protein B n=1 Tax=Vagococcus intermedius TaxID=2991418 RepID=A0AAF0CWK5_9ENTE|nr:disulfide bond formation protein B [Vagococcus intermedius]WEG74209.1 disulfide bond formation protein B [Vagococcus intermedius]WEG76290.1 disulfide bond formation protein B [Vagococcus intermedius]